ncbi:hypothetical protein BOTBODRAFT_144599 [Botryobasidium botryosum FD-172 SS1]|uniref:Uncharacterized protein n=1 Tax=Botryobasidium botryosum (strain FD-172 SS1) TaxID=930990 RepID=A0A067MX95_BOTB1|nr:hypothetical protein BOTBODRAFT_144599 [Botryobasidium botryosum FD-172 SS1]
MASSPVTLFTHAEKIAASDEWFFDELFDTFYRHDRDITITQRTSRINAFLSHPSSASPPIDDFYTLPPIESIPIALSKDPVTVAAFLKWFDTIVVRHGLDSNIFYYALMRYVPSEYHRAIVQKLATDEEGNTLPWIGVLKNFWKFFGLYTLKRTCGQRALNGLLETSRAKKILKMDDFNTYVWNFEFANNCLWKPFKDVPHANLDNPLRSEMEKSRNFYNGLPSEFAQKVLYWYERSNPAWNRRSIPSLADVTALARIILAPFEEPEPDLRVTRDPDEEVEFLLAAVGQGSRDTPQTTAMSIFGSLGKRASAELLEQDMWQSDDASPSPDRPSAADLPPALVLTTEDRGFTLTPATLSEWAWAWFARDVGVTGRVVLGDIGLVDDRGQLSRARRTARAVTALLRRSIRSSGRAHWTDYVLAAARLCLISAAFTLLAFPSRLHAFITLLSPAFVSTFVSTLLLR